MSGWTDEGNKTKRLTEKGKILVEWGKK